MVYALTIGKVQKPALVRRVGLDNGQALPFEPFQQFSTIEELEVSLDPVVLIEHSQDTFPRS